MKYRALPLLTILAFPFLTAAQLTGVGGTISGSTDQSQSGTIFAEVEHQPRESLLLSGSLNLAASRSTVTNQQSKADVLERTLTVGAGLSATFDDNLLLGFAGRASSTPEEKTQSSTGQLVLAHSMNLAIQDKESVSIRNRASLSQTNWNKQQDNARPSRSLSQTSWSLSSKIRPLKLLAARIAYRSNSYDRNLQSLLTETKADESTTNTTAGFQSTIENLSTSDTTLEVSIYPTDDLELIAGWTSSPLVTSNKTSQTLGLEVVKVFQKDYEASLGATQTTTPGQSTTSRIEVGLTKNFD